LLEALERCVNREKEIAMAIFLQNSRIMTIQISLMSFIRLISAAPVAPAAAQSAPAGLLRLDPPRPSNDIAQLPDDQRAKVRGAYAHSRKIQPRQ
jgi:hypothetical protein